MRIAFAGNPNSGKTTMYNAVTGSNEHVGNWAGVTVEKKQGKIKKSFYEGAETLIAVDLPGVYSITPFTSEESVTAEYIKNENPDVIVNIVDATNLSRSLFFTTQLLELGVPVVVALNKKDINAKDRRVIDTEALSKALGCPAILTSSVKKKDAGLKEVIKTALESKGKTQAAPYRGGDVTDKESALRSDKERYEFVKKLVKDCERSERNYADCTRTDKIDNILTSPLWGLVIFAAVMFLVFQISQAWVGPLIAEGYEFENGTVIPGLVTLTDRLGEWVGGLIEGASPVLQSLLLNGIIGGVGAVIGFLPLVMVMYFLIALLEDCGYMARVSVVLDPIFKKVGLSGKSVIPFVIGTGCSIPGIMACRTIRDVREKRATAMLTSFMPCGAKLPVIALFSGVFFGDTPWVGTLMYFAGIAIILVAALIIKKINGLSKKKSYFIIELPEYKLPSVKRAGLTMCQRGWAYIVKAGTVILLCNTVVQIMETFSPTLTPAVGEESILAYIATPLAYILAPIVGVVSWQLTAAAITGFIAKENIVGTLAVCFGISQFISEDLTLTGGEETVAAKMGITAVAALAYLVFNLSSPPCFAALGAMRAEIEDRKWFWGAIGLQLGIGFTAGFAVYFVGTLVTGNAFPTFWMPVLGIIVSAVFVLTLVYLSFKADKRKDA